jgi:hypothetical protein
MQFPQNSKLNKTTFLSIYTGLFLQFFFIIGLHATPNPEITVPTNGTTYIEGDTVKIKATVSNPTANTIVEFYINNVYIGNDLTAPYQLDWISLEGMHLITTKETRGTCQKTHRFLFRSSLKKIQLLQLTLQLQQME